MFFAWLRPTNKGDRKQNLISKKLAEFHNQFNLRPLMIQVSTNMALFFPSTCIQVRGVFSFAAAWNMHTLRTMQQSIVLISVSAIEGKFSVWGDWGECSVTCGTGSRSRDRTCTNPVPQNGGADCQGSSSETETCGKPPCREYLIYPFAHVFAVVNLEVYIIPKFKI